MAAGTAMAQDSPIEMRSRRALVAIGQRLDLDSGLILHVAKEPPYVADLGFDRDGLGLILRAEHGLARGRPDDVEPGEHEWTKAALRIPSDRKPEKVVWFVKTDCGAIARVEVLPGSEYTNAALLVHWTAVSAATPEFRPAPRNPRIQWSEGRVELRWEGDADRYQVIVTGGNGVTQHATREPRLGLPLSDAEETRSVRVHALSAEGVPSLPLEFALRGTRTRSARGVIEYPDRWYDVGEGGGLSLLRGEASAGECDVVFYLYGTYVRGGGVQRLGKGEACYLAATELPTDGYRPFVDRLDEGSVLAVRLADGRLAKLWLEATDGRDLRSGMRVHFAFLAGGGASFPARPTKLRVSHGGAGVELAWPPVSGAARYRVSTVGGEARPEIVEKPGILLRGLAKDRVHEARVVAIDAMGDESDPISVTFHTFGKEFTHGSFELDCMNREAIALADASVFRAAANGQPSAEGDLAITNSAGGTSGLTFSAPHGIRACDPKRFGDFPTDPGTGFRDTHQSDDRSPATMGFWVRLADGRIACVRIADSKFPKVRFEYLLAPKR